MTKKHIRVITVRIEPDDETRRLLRQRAMEAAGYRNKWAQAHLAQALKWTPPEGAPKDSLTKLVRADHRGELSSSVYSACETEVKKDWERAKRRIMAGAPLPQYRTADSLAFATITGRAGVQIIEREPDRFDAELMANAADVHGGCWISAPISRRTRKDEYRVPMLRRFATGDLQIDAARVVFKFHSAKTLLQLTYKIERDDEAGDLHATLALLSDGRLLLRCGDQAIDYTSRITQLDQLREQWDAITRRWSCQISRRRGAARIRRRKNASLRFDDRRDSLLHQWSREMAEWLVAKGAGTLSVAEAVGGNWAASRLKAMLDYKCKERGIELVEPTLADPETERTVKAALRRRARRAKKDAEAIRQLRTSMGSGLTDAA